jgi:hypothetical protein
MKSCQAYLNLVRIGLMQSLLHMKLKFNSSKLSKNFRKIVRLRAVKCLPSERYRNWITRKKLWNWFVSPKRKTCRSYRNLMFKWTYLEIMCNLQPRLILVPVSQPECNLHLPSKWRHCVNELHLTESTLTNNITVHYTDIHITFMFLVFTCQCVVAARYM